MKKHLTHIVWGGVSLILALSAATSCQQQLNVSDAALEPVDEIIFHAADPSLSAEVATKATAVTSLTSFNVSAVTGAAGSETAVWTNVAFSGNNTDGYKAAAPGKWWPSTDASYRFYAANSALTFAASGATVAATNATDIVCAYMASPTYKAKNTLSFEHIFARLGQVTVSAASGYTISGVSIKITPKTGGTYNLLTGAGKTDGTGWSGLTTGSETVIGNTVGNTANDIYLVPGTYTLTASWTATKGDYTENIENMTCDVNLVAGKINKISTTLSGNAKEIVFNVSIAPWTDNNQVVEFPTEWTPSFGGLQIAPGNLYWNGLSFDIATDWNHNNYNYGYYGKNYSVVYPEQNAGSYYLSFLEVGSFFDADGNSFNASSGNIDNANKLSFGGYDDWRVPTEAEMSTIFGNGSPGVNRAGATVNGETGYLSALIKITNTYYAGGSNPIGVLVFPDEGIITGKTFLANSVKKTGGASIGGLTNDFTLSDLNNYLEQGCEFLPAGGYCYNGTYSSADSFGYYMTNHSDSNSSCRICEFYAYSPTMAYLNVSSAKDKGTVYMNVRLVRNK